MQSCEGGIGSLKQKKTLQTKLKGKSQISPLAEKEQMCTV